MRIDITKANPYHDKKGRFAKANSRLGTLQSDDKSGVSVKLSANDTPTSTAQNQYSG